MGIASPQKANVDLDYTAFKYQVCWDILVAAIGQMPMVRAEVPVGGLIGASARWFDIRRSAILGAATGIPPDIPLWLERRRPDPLGSLPLAP